MSVLPYDDRDGEIWYNGQMVPWRDAKIHVLNHGLHYASCVFEGERVYDGRIFKLREHSERLRHSAALLGFELPFSVEELDSASSAVCEANGVRNGYVRPVAWRGSEMMAIANRQSKVHVAIAAWEWGNYFAGDTKTQGVRLTTSAWKRPAPDSAPTASKAAGLYMICTLSKHAAEDAGFTDALMLDYRGYVAEATGANMFFVMDGELHTPTADCFLNGITRRTVMELASARGIKVVERHIKPEEIERASEVFLTGTAAEITPVAQIDTHHFAIGTLTSELMADYHALVHQPSES